MQYYQYNKFIGAHKIEGDKSKMTNNIESKQKQFILAMDLYENKKIYQLFGKFISTINISLQVIIIYLVIPMHIGALWQIFSFIVAYVLTDFINGLVHMYMDNNDNYESIAGPLIASFHLHHRTPLYTKKNILVVYFNESGSKIWLSIFMIIAAIVIGMFNVNGIVAYIILYFSILSSIAELSHYLCHVSNAKSSKFLRKIGFLLNKPHHGKHHMEDNVNYAFLNGISDPLINVIAKSLYAGYKNNTDKHYTYYNGNDTKNRS